MIGQARASHLVKSVPLMCTGFMEHLERVRTSGTRMEGGGNASEGYRPSQTHTHTQIQMVTVSCVVVAAVGFSVLQFFMF